MADESLEDQEETRKPGRACDGSRQDLIKCLRESDCVRVVRGVVGGWSINYVCFIMHCWSSLAISMYQLDGRQPHPHTSPMCTVTTHST